jgi:NAD(P)-dependent dehydrogenase (short-subunit alcohol dehydrogenase family)
MASDNVASAGRSFMMIEMLKGQRVLIVGGSSGIGLASAKAAVAAGALVTIGSHNDKTLGAAAEEIGSVNVTTRLVNILENASIEALFAASVPYHHIVVTAAWAKVGSLHDLSLEDGYKSMESKFWGSYKIARAAKFAESGSLTLISGAYSQRPDRNAVLQGAINAAVEGLVRGLALDLAPIRVNVISPGLTNTPLYAGMDPQERAAMMHGVAESLPVRRVGEPADIAQAVLFAMSNPYLTGTTITVDGGGFLG